MFGILVLLLALPFPARGQSCVIDATHAGDIRIGASKAQVLAQLSPRYAVTGNNASLAARPRGGGADSRPVVEVNFDDADRAFLIDSYEPCATKEGVGPGMFLGRAQKIYGRGSVDPTDSGYFVWFERKKGVMFLLDDRDIPRSLREIPDDVLTPDHARQILSLAKARVVAVRVSGP